MRRALISTLFFSSFSLLHAQNADTILVNGRVIT